MEREWTIASLEELENVVKEIIIGLGKRKIALYGDLGAGKTAWVKKAGKVLGIKDEISSPTFSLVNEYLLPDGNRFYHLDVYRLNDPAEIFDLGFEEFLGEKDYVFIEWAQKVEQFIPSSFCKIEITLLADAKRKVLLIEDFL